MYYHKNTYKSVILIVKQQLHIEYTSQNEEATKGKGKRQDLYSVAVQALY